MTTGTRLGFLDAAGVLFVGYVVTAFMGAPWWCSAGLLALFFVALFVGSGFKLRYGRGKQ